MYYLKYILVAYIDHGWISPGYKATTRKEVPKMFKKISDVLIWNYTGNWSSTGNGCVIDVYSYLYSQRTFVTSSFLNFNYEWRKSLIFFNP